MTALMDTITLVAGLCCFVMPGYMVQARAEPPVHSPLSRIAELNPHLSSVDPRELPMKVLRLLKNPYEFFRGTADLFTLWCKEHCSDWLQERDTIVLLHGDVHPGNVGTWRTDRRDLSVLTFGLVDLDEAARGPMALDLMRAVTSLRMAADVRGIHLKELQWRDVVDRLCARYAAAWEKPNTTDELRREFKHIDKLLKKAEKESYSKYVASFLLADDSMRFAQVRIKKDEPSDLLEQVTPKYRAALVAGLWPTLVRHNATSRTLRYKSQEEFEGDVADAARWTRLESSGSQGVEKYLVLLRSPFEDSKEPAILELKSEPSPATARTGILAARPGAARAAEVVGAYSLLLQRPPWLVGYAEVAGCGFKVRVKDPYNKELSGVDIEKHSHLVEVAEILGACLGAAHRHAMQQPGPVSQAIGSTAHSEAFHEALWKRCRAAYDHSVLLYAALKHDPAARRVAATAESFIAHQVDSAAERP